MPDMSGECVVSSVLSCSSKDLKPWTSVTAQLQLRVLFAKQRKAYPHGVRVGQPQRRGLDPPWLPPFICLSPPPMSLPYANWAGQEGGKVLTLVCGFSLVPSLQAFSFLCLLATDILDSFFLF